MNGALGPNPNRPADTRPHQQGAAQGQSPTGQPVNITKNWLFDTGAGISGITAANAANFRINNIGGGWVRVAAGSPIPVTTGDGIAMVFQKHGPDGRDHNVSCRLMIVTNFSEDIIGVDQMRETHCWPVCDPDTGVGQLLDSSLVKELLNQSKRSKE